MITIQNVLYMFAENEPVMKRNEAVLNDIVLSFTQ